VRPSYGDVRSAVDRAVQGVKAHPEFQPIRIHISAEGSTEGWFDFKKLERALLNLFAKRVRSRPGGSREDRDWVAPSGRKSGNSHRR